ncbi:MAG: DHH family phosphoesterase [Desulfobulbaceae bacterium]|nr:DHH family phosphoesterase [Desulfobulbaceae bacterium]
MNNLKILIEDLKKNTNSVYIQCHDYPDPDAVSSAFGLQYTFSEMGLKSLLIHEGHIQRDALRNMISHLNINLRHASEYDLNDNDKIVIVDACLGNKNITNLVGDEIAIVDHHQLNKNSKIEDVGYVDIRGQYGACSTIIFEYLTGLEIDIPKDIATALQIGILIDTAGLTRSSCPKDIDAYSELHKIADMEYVNETLRNNIQKSDLKNFTEAIEKATFSGQAAFYYFNNGCSQNLMGIIGDFLLSLHEIKFVCLCARNTETVNISVRSEEPDWNASLIIQNALKGVGYGGGHAHMAGGEFSDLSKFDKKSFFKKIENLLISFN